MAFLDYLLGGVSGGFEGYERKKARELQAQKDEEERQIKQLAMLGQLGFRATGFAGQGTAPAARNTVADISANLPKPISDTKLGSAFEAARQRGFGIEPPPASPLTSPVSLALDAVPRKVTTPAAPVAPRRTMKAAGMEFELKSPEEVAQEEKQRAIDEYRQKQIIDQEIATNKANAEKLAKDKEVEDTATLLQESYVGPDGKPITRKQALYSARMGKDPIDLGFVQRAMTQAERERLNIARGNLSIAQQRLNMDKEAKQNAAADVQNFYDEERKTIAQFMPQPYKDKSGVIRYKAPAVDLTKGVIGSQNLALTRSDWTNWAASEDAQRYASAVKRISDSYAVAKEGRGASNADKESYLNAVMVRPGEFKNYRLMQEKWQRLQSYINYLESKEKKGVSNRQSAGTAGGSALMDLENMGMD